MSEPEAGTQAPESETPRSVTPDDGTTSTPPTDGDVAGLAADRTFADAIPWLTHLTREERITVQRLTGNRSWTVPPTKHELVSEKPIVDLAAVVLAHRDDDTLGTIVDIPLGPYGLRDIPGLSRRAANALVRAGVQTVRSLRQLRIEEIKDLRSVGPATTTNIVASVMRLAIAGPTRTPDRTPGVLDRTDGDSALLNELAADLLLVARWRLATGDTTVPLLAPLSAGTPPEAQRAYDRLTTVTAADLRSVDTVDLAGDTAALALDGSIRALSDRYRQVAQLRTFADEPAPYSAVGRSIGTSAERARQIDKRLRERITANTRLGTPLGDLLAYVRAHLQTPVRLESLLATFPALAHDVPAAGRPLWKALSALDEVDVVDGWVALPPFSDAVTAARSAANELADDDGVVELSALMTALAPDADHADALDWIRTLGFTVVGDRVLTRTSNVKEVTTGVLTAAGSPLRLDDLVQRLNGAYRDGTIRNLLYADPAFHRVAPETWALRSWGLPDYISIRAAIDELLADSGGAAPVDHVVAAVSERLGVTSDQVVTATTRPPFTVRDGMVRNEPGHATIRKQPSGTQRLFRVGDRWAYRIRLTRDHTRGRSAPLPLSASVVLGLEVGQSLTLRSRLGDQRITRRPTVVQLGTIRRFLVDLGATEGDTVFLVFGPDDFDVVRPRTPRYDAGWERASVLAGLPEAPDGTTALAELATAVGLDRDASLPAIAEQCRRRGDRDIANLLDPRA